MHSNPTYKQIWNISYPLIIGGVGQTVINISDTIFLGRVSEVALGASAIAGLYYFTFFMLGVGFSIGTQICVARFSGEKSFLKIGNVMRHSAAVMLFMAVVLFGLMYFSSEYFLHQIIKSDEILKSTIAFIKYRSGGIFGGFFVLLVRAYFTGIANTKMVGYTTFISAICNLIFNYLFVFGHFGFPRMEIAGSGLASSLAETVSAVFALIYLFRYGNLSKYAVFESFKFDIQIFRQLIRTSIPLMIQLFLALWSWFAFFLIIEKMGKQELAISNLTRNVYMILMICLMGFSNATNTIVSNIIGQKEYGKLFQTLRKIVVLSFCTSLLIVVVQLFLMDYSLSIFTNSQLLIERTRGSIYVISGSTLFFSVAYILLSAVSGIGDTLVTLAIEVTTLIFYLYATYLLAVKLHSSIELVWCTEYVYFIFMGIISYTYIRWKIRKLQNS